MRQLPHRLKIYGTEANENRHSFPEFFFSEPRKNKLHSINEKHAKSGRIINKKDSCTVMLALILWPDWWISVEENCWNWPQWRRSVFFLLRRYTWTTARRTMILGYAPKSPKIVRVNSRNSPLYAKRANLMKQQNYIVLLEYSDVFFFSFRWIQFLHETTHGL